jgi:hypothetical protein
MSTEITERPAAVVSQKIVVTDAVPMLDTGMFEHMQRVATVLAASPLLPDHLRGAKRGDVFTPYEQNKIVANAFLVVNQAVRWMMDPFALAAESYVVGGKLAFQGKVIQALVNKRAGLKTRLSYDFSGAGEDRKVTVTGTFDGETERRSVEVVLKNVKTANQLWKTDPDQKLVYNGCIKWARRFASDVVLGVLTDDDLERMAENRTPHTTMPVSDAATKSERIALEMSAPTTPAGETFIETEAQTPSAVARYEARIAAATLDTLADVAADFDSDPELSDSQKSHLAKLGMERQQALTTKK